MTAEAPYSRDATGVRHDWTAKDFDAQLDTLSKRAEVLGKELAEDAYQNDRVARKAEILNKILLINEQAQDEGVADLVKVAGVEEEFGQKIQKLVDDLIEEARAI